MSVTVTKGSASQADYYRQGDPFFDAEGNKWQGKGLDSVGLESGQPIDYLDFKALYAGIHPLSSDRAGEQIIPDGGFDSHEVGHHKAGYDMTISPDKSVSVGFALGLPGIEEAVHDAMDATVAMAEELATARRKVDGVEMEVPTGNLIVASINHSVTRETDVDGELVPDCNLHRHTVIMNATVRPEPDGSERLVSLKSTTLLENQGATSESLLNQTFNSQLAANLRDAGYSADIDGNGNAKLAGIPEPVCVLHSKRSQAIEQRTEELRESGFAGATEGKLRQIANFDTREGKTHLTGDEIRASWDAQLQNSGYSKEAIIQAVHDAGKEQGEQRQKKVPMTAHDYIRGAAQYLSEQGAFSKRDLLQTAMLDAMGDVGARELVSAFGDLVKSKNLVGLDTKDKSIGSLDKTFTTKEIAGKQKVALATIEHGYSEPMMTEREAQKTLYNFVQEQRKDDPNFRLSQADWQMMRKVLTTDQPHIFVNAENEAERGKAYDLIKKVTFFHAEQQTALVSSSPATELQKSSAMAGIERDIHRDKAIAEIDGHNTDFAALVGKAAVDAIRQKSLREAAASFKRHGDRNIAGMIVAEADDKEIRKATGATLQGIVEVRNKLFTDASYRAEKHLESEMDKQTVTRQEARLKSIEELGRESKTPYAPKASEARMRDVITFPQGQEQILSREGEEKGIREMSYGKHHKWGGCYGSMMSYSVKGHGDKHLAVGHNKSISHGCGFKTQKADRVIWAGAGKGNRVQSSRTTYGAGFWEKTKTKDAVTGTVREIKSRGIRQSFAGFTLYESKTQHIKETDKEGNVSQRTTKTTSFLGYKFGKTISKNADGSITETKWRGYEKSNIWGQKKLVITHQETVTKPAKPSLFVSLAMALIGDRKPDALSAYVSRADQRGRFVEAPQEKGFNSIKSIAQEAATKDVRNTTVLTYSRGRAEALNAAIRSELQAKGHLEKGMTVEAMSVNSRTSKIETKSLELSNGDRIRFGQASKELGIRGGESGSIKSIDSKGNLTVHMDFPDKTGKHERNFNIRDYRTISYDYARTDVDKRTAVGKVIVDIHSGTTNKGYLAKVDSAVRQGFDIRFVGDKKELIKAQAKQYDDLKDKYRSLVESEKKTSGIIGKSVTLAQKGGNSVMHTMNARVADYDAEKGTVSLEYKHGKSGKAMVRTHSADQVLVNGGNLVLPESQVRLLPMFKDTVFERGIGGKPNLSQLAGKKQSPQLMAEKGTSGKEFVMTSAESRTMNPAQASKELARMDKDSRSERLTIIDGDQLNAKQTSALIRETERQGNRAVVIGSSKELLGVSPERLQERSQNVLDMSKHPEIVNQKTSFLEKMAGKTGKDIETRTVEMKYVEIPKERRPDNAMKQQQHQPVQQRVERYRNNNQMDIGG